MVSTSYLIGLGSNRRHGRHGSPSAILCAALAAMEADGILIVATSAIRRTSALGPSDRDFANAAALVSTSHNPPALLHRLKRIEQAFGRRPGRRWGARVLDLDILAWSAGAWPHPPRRAPAGQLAIPHRAIADRDFAIEPAARLMPHWRHPYHHATLRQLARRRRKVLSKRLGGHLASTGG